VLDCDAYEAFLETGDIFNKEVATKFRKEILERGREEDAMNLYINFRGKRPGIEPLLKNRGLN
jgi:peptidyl-dipeptidase Dcp